jgi:NAD(P)H dehydrogenase (quinone)
MDKLLVTGATGHLGGAVVETLLKSIVPGRIAILTRSEEKRAAFQAKGVNAFLGDYNDVGTLEQAMNGVATVLLVSAGDQGDRMREHRNVIDTATKKGVTRIAYTSRCLRDRNTLANKLMTEHFETEDHIRASGLKYTFFRNVLYMDAIPQFVGGSSALENGIFLPAGEGRVAFALRSELGEAMSQALLKETDNNSVYHFTGSQAYSFHEVATALGELSGKEVNYTAVEPDQFAGMLKQKNVPEPMIRKIADFITDIRHDQEAAIYNDLEHQLGRKPTGLKEGLKIVFGL